MDKTSFLLIGFTDGSQPSEHLPTLATLFEHGLDGLYWRHGAPLTALANLSPELQAAIIVPQLGSEPVPQPFRAHLKERERLANAGASAFSTSIHDLNEWPKLIGRVEMVFFSPLFPSISKPGYGPSLSLRDVTQQVAALRAAHPHLPRLIGLGGIDIRTVGGVRLAGFDGAALMGALWQTPDPVAAFSQLKGSAGR